MKLYETLVEELTRSIDSGVLRPGDRVPSVRELTRSRSVSPGTVLQAYGVLEDQGRIEARPRSGYYVSVRGPGPLPLPETRKPNGRPGQVAMGELVFEVLASARDRNVVPFGSAFPSPELFPFKQLSHAFGAAARFLDPWKTVSDLSPGNLELRRQIARRYLEVGCTVKPDEILITCGAMEALNLCLQSVARPGDLIAIESPAFYASLQIIEALGLRAVEVATEPLRGVDLDALAQAIKRHRIKACWFMTNYQNPLGSLMPLEKKRALVELLRRHEIPLIEDDVYAELHLKGTRPKPAKAFDEDGLVLHCSSYSKCLAPGFRVGWVVAGRSAERVQQRQLSNTLTPSVPAQLAIVEYLKHGGYERHLRQLRKALSDQQVRLLEAVRRYFPDGTRVTQPDGGYFAWVELPEGVDAVRVYRAAMKANVSVSPGPIFSAQRGFENCLRINYGHPWSPALEQGIRTLAHLASRQLG
ncbi:MAG: PLP-dependent aminotransferase family protein [Myxococcales bacterium]